MGIPFHMPFGLEVPSNSEILCFYHNNNKHLLGTYKVQSTIMPTLKELIFWGKKGEGAIEHSQEHINNCGNQGRLLRVGRLNFTLLLFVGLKAGGCLKFICLMLLSLPAKLVC